MKSGGVLVIAVAAALAARGAGALEVALPTPNSAIFEGGPEFYMYVDRNFQGRKSRPWQGGKYGFVRTPVMVDGRKVYRRFHEGIDIKPLRRSSGREPLDPVMAVADGIVRHVNRNPAHSNYGRYIVIEHDWDGSPVMSLYAHLGALAAERGQRVERGEKLAIMGYSGRGLNRRRAHLHFEIGLLYNDDFEGWHQTYFAGSPNRHGIYNGLNIFSADPVEFFARLRRDPATTPGEFFRSQPAFFTVRIANPGDLQLLRRYPWLAGGHAGARPRSWEISFTRSGLAVAAEPSDIAAAEPKLVSIKNSDVPYRYVTRGLVGGGQGSATLSHTGRRTMHLLTYPE